MDIFTYQRTYTLTDQVLDVHVDLEELITSYPAGKIYFEGITPMYGNIVLDISAYLQGQSLVTLRTTKDIVKSFTQLLIDRYKTSTLPLKDIHSGAYENRVETLNVNGVSEFTVQFTSIDNPSLRDRLETKNLCRDLVITGNNNHSLKDTIFTVNGVAHRQYYDPSNNEMYLTDGYLNCRRTGKTNICSIDFQKVGNVALDQVVEEAHFKLPGSIHSQVYLTSTTSLKNTFPILILDGYIFFIGDIVQVVGENTLRVDLRKLDIPALYTGHPLTQYKRGIAYQENLADGIGLEFPNTIDKTIFEQGNPHNLPELNNRGKELFPYPKYYRSEGEYTNTYFLEENFNNPEYIKYLFTNGQTRIVLIDNPHLLKRVYTGIHIFGAYLYDIFSKDTPRGILTYNSRFVYPYTVMSNGTNTIHHLYIGDEKVAKDLYKTKSAAPRYIAPRVDEREYAQGLPVELTELYSA